MNWLKAKWLALPESVRAEVISAFHTFVTAFGVAISVQWQSGIEWKPDALIAVGSVAARAALKVALAQVWGWLNTKDSPK